MKKETNQIEEWLTKYGTPEMEEQVAKEAAAIEETIFKMRTIKILVPYTGVMAEPIPRIFKPETSIFLAGSIEMGKAKPWQKKVTKFIQKNAEKNITIYNPRREDWDDSWEQTISNDNFFEQVRWEIQGLAEAGRIMVYLDPSTKSPISLLEIGMYHNSGKMDIICPPGFYRRGNIEVLCWASGIPLYNSLEDYKEKFLINYIT